MNSEASIFRQEALLSQVRPLEGKVLLQLPVAYRLLTGLIILLIALFILFLFYGSYSRSQPASGWVLPVEGMTKIWGSNTGIVQSIVVSEGESVKKGDLLAHINTTMDMMGGTQLEHQLILQAKNSIDNITQSQLQTISFQQVEILGIESKISQTKNINNKRLVELVLQQKRLQLIQQEKNNIKKLQQQGYVTRSQLDEKQLVELESQLVFQRLQRSQLEVDNQLSDLIKQKELLKLEHNLKQAEFDRELIQQKRQLLELESHLGYAITAPVSGVVTLIQKKTGQSIQSNQPFAVIVPKSAQFEVELLVPSMSIGFLQKGQSVKIRYQAFPYQRYGIYTGKIREISDASLDSTELSSIFKLPNSPYYRIRITLEKQFVSAEGKPVPLRTGMLVNADLVLEKLPIWYWFFKPLLGLKIT